MQHAESLEKGKTCRGLFRWRIPGLAWSDSHMLEKSLFLMPMLNPTTRFFHGSGLLYLSPFADERPILKLPFYRSHKGFSTALTRVSLPLTM